LLWYGTFISTLSHRNVVTDKVNNSNIFCYLKKYYYYSKESVCYIILSYSTVVHSMNVESFSKQCITARLYALLMRELHDAQPMHESRITCAWTAWWCYCIILLSLQLIIIMTSQAVLTQLIHDSCTSCALSSPRINWSQNLI